MKVRLSGGTAFRQPNFFLWCKDIDISVVGSGIHSTTILQSEPDLSVVVIVSWVNFPSTEEVLL